MGRDLATWRLRQGALLGNPTDEMLSPPDRDQLTLAAVRKFSVDRPRKLYVDYTGNGSSFAFTPPAAWVNGFSSVLEVEYPQGERPPVYIDLAEVQLYPSVTSPTTIQLNRTTPSVGKVARVTYTVPWPIPDGSASTDLIPDTSFEPVARLAAAGGALQLAARAAANKRSSMPSADLAAIEAEESRWMDLAKELLAEYQEHVGTRDGPAPASANVDWDAMSDWWQTSGQFLFRWGRR